MSNAAATKKTKKSAKSVETITPPQPVAADSDTNNAVNNVTSDVPPEGNVKTDENTADPNILSGRNNIKSNMSFVDISNTQETYRAMPLTEKRELYMEVVTRINSLVSEVKAYDDIRLNYLKDLSDEIEEATNAEEQNLDEDEDMNYIKDDDKDKEKEKEKESKEPKKNTKKKANTTELNTGQTGQTVQPEVISSVSVSGIDTGTGTGVDNSGSVESKKKTTRKKVTVEATVPESVTVSASVPEQVIPTAKPVESDKKKTGRKKTVVEEQPIVAQTPVSVEPIQVSTPVETKKRTVKKKT